ncbi:hypothetical protein C8J57DRAFT_94808 [Mycena rebaudengoi]|nr:hypothetical protein C8J57DRAFT_94808 [Mycena rebaudengoi]
MRRRTSNSGGGSFAATSSSSATFPKPKATDIMSSRLPIELLTAIFSLVLHPVNFRHHLEFTRMRSKLCNTSSIWMRFINLTECFWTRILITVQSYEDVELHFLRSGKSCLDIRIDLTRLPYLLPSESVHSDSLALMQARVALIASVFHRCNSLKLEFDNEDYLEHMRILLLPLDPTTLQDLTIRYNRHTDIGMYSDDNPGPFASLPWFTSPLRSLRYLMVRSVGLSWQTSGLHLLSQLRINGLLNLCPTYEDYAFVIQNCANLQLLRLSSVGCRDLDDGTAGRPSITSTSMRSLHLGFADFDSLGHLASLFRFPNLHTLHIHAKTTSSLCPALLCTPLYAQLGVLQLKDAYTLTPLMECLALRLPLALPPKLDSMLALNLSDPRSDLSYTIRLNPFSALTSAEFINYHEMEVDDGRPLKTLTLELPGAGAIMHAQPRTIRRLRERLNGSGLIHMPPNYTPSFQSTWMTLSM